MLDVSWKQVEKKPSRGLKTNFQMIRTKWALCLLRWKPEGCENREYGALLACPFFVYADAGGLNNYSAN